MPRTHDRLTADWQILPFRAPQIISDHPEYCGCSWVWAPDKAGGLAFPWIIKFPNRLCTGGHDRDYFTGKELPHGNATGR